MSKQENFNPGDPKYKTVEDLPAEERAGFVKVDGGFVRQGAYDIEKAGEEAKEIAPQEQEKSEIAPTSRRETPLEFLHRARGEDLADRGRETLQLIDSLDKEEKTAALTDAKQKVAEALARATEGVERKRQVLDAAREKLGIPAPENEEDTHSLALKLERQKKLSSLLEEIEARKANTEKVETTAETEEGKEYVQTLRESLGPIAEDINRLNSIFRRREGNRLQPLMDERDIAKLSAVSGALIDLTSGRMPRSEEIAEGISRVAAAFGEYGNVRGRGALREDGESLRQVGFSIRRLADSARTAQERIAQKRRDTPEYQAISRLSQTLETALSFHSRRVAAFERYIGR